MSDDTARTVEKGEIKKAYKFGGEQIAFTPEEVTSLRYFGDPGIRILGFKPLAMLPIWANLRPSTFIYPSEEEVVGSTRVFAAMQQKLLNDEKMGLAWFVPRKNATPVIAAVVPGAEKLGEHGEQVIPPGMWIIPLPFVDDIRQNPETSLIRAPESLVDLMRNVIQQLQLPKAQYNPERYPNPCKGHTSSIYTFHANYFLQLYNGITVSYRQWRSMKTSPSSRMIRQYQNTTKFTRYVL